MGKSSSPPPPPDPHEVADAQSQQNRDSADYNAALNRINTYTPWGSQEYSTNGVDPRTGAPIYSQHINLTPEQQLLLDTQTEQNLRIGNLGNGVLDQLNGQPIDTSGLPSLQGGLNVNGPQLSGTYANHGPQMGIDTAGLPALPGLGDLAAFRDGSEQALYDRNTRYMDRDYDRREDAMRTRLANQGIVEGSEAYRNAVDDFERGRDTSYAQARDAAIAGGGAEAERMFGIGSISRGQMYGEALSGGSFANSAAAQATAQNRDAAAFNNTTRGQAISEALMEGGFANDARAQGMSEAFALRNQPINEFNSMRSMSQVQTPQFQGTYNATSPPADITGAYNNQYQGQLDAYNAGVSQDNSTMNTIGQIAAMVAMMYSDENLKEDIHPIGELNDGTSLYAYRYKGDSTPQVGVMAQEVEKTQPEAVAEDAQGYKMVNYGKVLAKALEAA